MNYKGGVDHEEESNSYSQHAYVQRRR